jgi:hypothetical protein
MGSAAAWQDGTLSPQEINSNALASNLTTAIQTTICSQLGLTQCSLVDITGINLSGGNGGRRVLVSVDSPATAALTDNSPDLMGDPEGASFVRAIRATLCGDEECDSVIVTPA